MSQRYFRRIHASGFTLVELIVVITILVILGTIGFIQLQGFSGSARDSARIENFSNLYKGLSLFQIQTGIYPMPENPVNITASGTVIGYQWFAKDQVGSMAKLSAGATKDPLDATMYTTYSVNANQTKMQVMAFLEDGSNVTAFIPEAFAGAGSDYSKRYPIVRGDTLGILLASGSLQPVQESGGGVDIVNTTGSYSILFDKDTKVSGTGTVLKSGIVSTSGLVGYWDMETMTGWLLRDLSGYGNYAYISGSLSIGWTAGKIGKSTPFPWVMWNYIRIPVSSSLNFVGKELTAMAWFNTNQSALEAIFFQHDQWNSWSWSLFNISTQTPPTCNAQMSACAYGSVSKWPAWNTGFASQTTVSDGTWHFMTLVVNSTTQKIFIDGKKESEITGSFLLPSSMYDLTIWADYNGDTDIFSGAIDEVRIYNRALSDSEIQTLYGATK